MPRARPPWRAGLAAGRLPRLGVRQSPVSEQSWRLRRFRQICNNADGKRHFQLGSEEPGGWGLVHGALCTSAAGLLLLVLEASSSAPQDVVSAEYAWRFDVQGLHFPGDKADEIARWCFHRPWRVQECTGAAAWGKRAPEPPGRGNAAGPAGWARRAIAAARCGTSSLDAAPRSRGSVRQGGQLSLSAGALTSPSSSFLGQQGRRSTIAGIEQLAITIWGLFPFFSSYLLQISKVFVPRTSRVAAWVQFSSPYSPFPSQWVLKWIQGRGGVCSA